MRYLIRTVGREALGASALLVALWLLTPTATSAQTGTIISGSIPPTGGFGIIVFGGGSNDQLVAASGCPHATAAFWATSNGQFVPYVPGSDVAAVNTAWNALFSGGIPATTGIIGRCVEAPTSGGAFTHFFLDEPGPALQVTQTAVRVGRHEGFDRMVFEFAGSELPGYRIEYLGGQAMQCGSGVPVTLEGAAVLKVTLRSTTAHDEGGMPTVTNTNPTPAFPTLRELRQTCDFEGVVEWVAGTASQQPFRVFELSSPTRLVIDVSH
ncbi:MAG: hypothetical protein AB7I38_01140 [Dehalococcoidia bacterium]